MRVRGFPAVLVLCAAAVAAGQALPPTRQIPPASPHAAPGVSYADTTATAGLSGFRNVSGDPAKNYIVEATGSGVAVFDYDNDGLADIYLLNGSTLDLVRSGRPAPRAAFYRNIGGGVFRDATAEAGLANERWGQGVCVGDIDNDGDEDIYVTNFGVNRLYRNDGGKFTDIAASAGVAVDSWSTGCAFGDFDGDGLLDLYVAGQVENRLASSSPGQILSVNTGLQWVNDFGFFRSSSRRLEGEVFKDLNGDGARQKDEPGVPGMKRTALSTWSPNACAAPA